MTEDGGKVDLSARLDALELAIKNLADHVFSKKGKPFPGAAKPFGKDEEKGDGKDSDGDNDGD